MAVAILADTAGREDRAPEALRRERRPGRRVVDRQGHVGEGRGDRVVLDADLELIELHVSVARAARHVVVPRQPDLEGAVGEVRSGPGRMGRPQREAGVAALDRVRVARGQGRRRHVGRPGARRRLAHRDLDATVRGRAAPGQAHVLEADLEAVDDEGRVVRDLGVEIEVPPDLSVVVGVLGRVAVVVGEGPVRVGPLPARHGLRRRVPVRVVGDVVVRGLASLVEAHAVVVLRAAHRDGQDVVGLRGPLGVPRRDPDRACEVRADRTADRDQQPPVVRRILDRGDHDATDAVRVAVLGGFRAGGGHGLTDLARQEHDACECGGIGGSLHAQVVRPVPGQVDDGRGEQHEEEHRPGEDDGNLAAFPRPSADGRWLVVPDGREVHRSVGSGDGRNEGQVLESEHRTCALQRSLRRTPVGLADGHGRAWDFEVSGVAPHHPGQPRQAAHGRTRWTGLPRMLTCQVVRSVLNELVLPPIV